MRGRRYVLKHITLSHPLLISYILHTLILYTDTCNIIFFVNCSIMHGSTIIQFTNC